MKIGKFVSNYVKSADLKKPQTSLLKSKTVKLAGAPASAEIYDYPADLPIAKDTSDTALLAAAGDHAGAALP
jgi:hypothetical protein